MSKLTNYLLAFLLLACILSKTYCQETTKRCRILGTVTEKNTDKPLKNIPVKLLPYMREVETDKKGQVLLNVPEGSYTLLIEYYPFDTVKIPLVMFADTSIAIRLTSPFESQYINPIEVLSLKSVIDYHTSTERMDKNWMDRLPSIVGEKDLLKTFALTSGVTSSSEGASDLQVRGGTHGQNLYLLDGIALYSTQHLFGLLSIFNPIAVQSAELYKGAFPARYGGKSSSVLDVKTVDAELNHWKGNAEIGLLSSKASLHIPIVKDKLGVFAAGRISNYSLFFAAIPDFFGETSLNTFFSDINVNLIWKPSIKDHLKLTFFCNRDGWNIKQPDNERIATVFVQNSQHNVGIKWSRTISERLKNELHLFSDENKFEFEHASEIKSANQYTSENTTTAIFSNVVTEQFQWKCNNRLSLETGGVVSLYNIAPLTRSYTDSTTFLSTEDAPDNFTEANLFVEGTYQLSKNHHIIGGFRSVGFFNNISYYSLEPRIRYHGVFSRNLAVSSSISKMSQSMHRIANAGLGFPFELFLPASSTLEPQESWIFTLGGSKSLTNQGGSFGLKLDFWYKKMDHIIDFKDGFDAQTILLYQKNFLNHPEDFVSQGKENAYGMDISAQLSFNRFSLSGDYTLMRAINQFDDLNNGKPYASSTDIRHSLSIISSIKLSDVFLLTANWYFTSGRPITIPNYIIKLPDTTFPYELKDAESGDYLLLTTDRANYRTKAFHKLDLSFMYNFWLFNRFKSSISFGVYNAYNRKNPFTYFIQNGKTSEGSTPELKVLSLFPTLPSVSLSVEF
jgi:hypothetical protein